MIITDDRARLDAALADPDTTIMVLSGDEESTAHEIHVCIHDAELEAWRKCFLITDLQILTDPEREEWFDDGEQEHYAVLGGKKSKKLATSGPVDDLIDDGEPSILEIRKAFGLGDKVK